MITGDDRLLNPPPGASPGSRSSGALVDSSDTVSPRPIAEVDAYFPATLGMPTTLTAALTANGGTVTQTFSTTGHQTPRLAPLRRHRSWLAGKGPSPAATDQGDRYCRERKESKLGKPD